MAKHPGPPPVYASPPYDLADAYAIRALAAGNADAEQQQRAIRWIVEVASARYQEHFRPEGARETDFALGRAFPGQQIVKLVNLSGEVLDKMRKGSKAPSEQS